jgi:hypothetical protein
MAAPRVALDSDKVRSTVCIASSNRPRWAGNIGEIISPMALRDLRSIAANALRPLAVSASSVRRPSSVDRSRVMSRESTKR